MVFRVTLVVLGDFGEDLNDVGLVVFHGDENALHSQDFFHRVDAVQHGTGILQGFPVVGGDIGLTLGGVDDEGVDFAQGVELAVGWEARSAQAHQAGFPHGGQELLRAVHYGRTDGRVRLHEAVGINDHSVAHLAPGKHHRLNRRDSAGHAGVDGGADKGVAVGNFLAQIDMVALFHQRLAGGADMLLHRQRHLLWHRQDGRGNLAGMFVMGYPGPAVGAEGAFREGPFHQLHSFFLYFYGKQGKGNS